MPSMETDEVQYTREDVLCMIDTKEKIEKEISNWKAVLDTNSVGMNGSLVDQEGFPRNDIDVYQVRHARHRIICLQNDHKDLMKQIENALHVVHARERDCPDVAMADLSVSRPQHTTPIARVKMVHPGSPAAASGLEVDDLILEFGTVNDSNFSSLKDIGAVVDHSIGVKVQVIVLRSGTRQRLQLTPHTWAGKGLLGCNILPMEDVDR